MRRLTSIQLSFDPCKSYCDCPRGVHRRSQNVQKCAKMANFQTSGLNYWETVEDRWVYRERRFTSIESSFQPCDTYRDCPRGVVYRGCRKYAKNVLKWRTFRLHAGLNYTGKRLKIDGYIQRGVLQALNSLSNRVTFTAIVPGATPYGGVKCKGVGKSCDFRPISRYSS